MTEQTLRDVFASQGFLANISLPRAPTTGKHAGFGYAKFRSVPAARAALVALQGAHVDGLAINLEFRDCSPPKLLQTSNAISEASNLHSRAPELTHDLPVFRRLRHRQSWHPTNQRSELTEPKHVSFTDGVTPGDSSQLLVHKGNHAPLHNSGNVHKAHVAPTNNIHDCDANKRLDPSSPNLGQDRSTGRSTAIQEGSDKPRDRALLDVDVDEMPKFSARYPPLLPGEDFTWPSVAYDASSVTATPDRLRALSPDVEMAQFPPVSQLDAHLLASVPSFNQQPKAAITRTHHDTNNGDTAQDHQLASRKQTSVARSQTLRVGRELHELQDGPPSVRSKTTFGPVVTEGESSSLDRNPQRHSNPVVPPAEMARLTRPFDPHIPVTNTPVDRGLRRRATERSPRTIHTHDALIPLQLPLRLTKREQDLSVPGSFPADDLSQLRESRFSTAKPDHITRSPFTGPSDRNAGMAVRRSAADDCVDTLIGLGYGAEKDGGRQRLTVYAEAVDGKLSDAIEMIEEDKKAYAQHMESYF